MSSIPRAHAGGVPIEEVADVDAFALVVAGTGPGGPPVEPRNALDVGVEIGEGHRRAGSRRTEVRRSDSRSESSQYRSSV